MNTYRCVLPQNNLMPKHWSVVIVIHDTYCQCCLCIVCSIRYSEIRQKSLNDRKLQQHEITRKLYCGRSKTLFFFSFFFSFFLLLLLLLLLLYVCLVFRTSISFRRLAHVCGQVYCRFTCVRMLSRGSGVGGGVALTSDRR